MFELVKKRFINNYQDVDNPKVREQYGVVCSILSIICNLIMVFFKLLFGTLVNSVSIVADGYNNLSDLGSNMATLFGFKLSNKHPDTDHPYGHGRFEYITGLIIAFLILLVGLTSLRESFVKIFNPEKVNFSVYALIVLVVSIGIKFWMASFNKKVGNLINSTSLKAASQDCLNDVLTTFATLIALLLSLVTSLPVDGIIGFVVSVIVLKGGYEIAKETIDPLLGQAPDKNLVKEIQDFVLSNSKILGIHDLVVHDYGPGRRYMSLHCEVAANENIIDVHEQIDFIENTILEKYNILTTIHVDPIDCHDEKTNILREKVIEIVKGINKAYSIHDFRIISCSVSTRLMFDVLLPVGDDSDIEEIKKQIEEKVKQIDKNYLCVIRVENAFL